MFFNSALSFSAPSFLPGQRARRQQVPAGLLQPAEEQHGRPEEATEKEGQEEPAVEDGVFHPRLLSRERMNAFRNQGATV